ncbi:MAG: hypothetical protein V7727_15810 [Sneathiella sp.]
MSVNQNYSINASINTGRHFHINEPANNNFPLPELNPRLVRDLCEKTSDIKGEKSLYLSSFLTSKQLKIANNLYVGFQLNSGKKNEKIQTLDGRVWREFVSEEESMDLLLRFENWMKIALGQGLSVSAVEEILIFGESLQSVDKSLKKYNGFAKKNLITSLGFYLNDFQNTP